jgi:uncharacterized RDD family membrane protein YckC
MMGRPQCAAVGLAEQLLDRQAGFQLASNSLIRPASGVSGAGRNPYDLTEVAVDSHEKKALPPIYLAPRDDSERREPLPPPVPMPAARSTPTLEAVAPSDSVEIFASTTARVAAYLLDALLLSAVLFGVALLAGSLIGPVVSIGESEAAVGRGRLTTSAIVSAAVSALYFIGSWLLLSATPGQRAVGMRVRRAGDRFRLTGGAATVRWLLLMGPSSAGAVVGTLFPLLRAWLGLGALLWSGFLLVTTFMHPARRGLHDRVAGSVVTSRALTARTKGAP